MNLAETAQSGPMLMAGDKSDPTRVKRLAGGGVLAEEHGTQEVGADLPLLSPGGHVVGIVGAVRCVTSVEVEESSSTGVFKEFLLKRRQCHVHGR
jgi:hypothetical protein